MRGDPGGFKSTVGALPTIVNEVTPKYLRREQLSLRHHHRCFGPASSREPCFISSRAVIQTQERMVIQTQDGERMVAREVGAPDSAFGGGSLSPLNALERQVCNGSDCGGQLVVKQWPLPHQER